MVMPRAPSVVPPFPAVTAVTTESRILFLGNGNRLATGDEGQVRGNTGGRGEWIPIGLVDHGIPCLMVVERR